MLAACCDLIKVQICKVEQCAADTLPHSVRPFIQVWKPSGTGMTVKSRKLLSWLLHLHVMLFTSSSLLMRHHLPSRTCWMFICMGKCLRSRCVGSTLSRICIWKFSSLCNNDVIILHIPRVLLVNYWGRNSQPWFYWPHQRIPEAAGCGMKKSYCIWWIWVIIWGLNTFKWKEKQEISSERVTGIHFWWAEVWQDRNRLLRQGQATRKTW